MFSVLRTLATCSADTTVKIWSISPNYEFKQEKVLIGHQRWVWDAAFSADSAYLVTGSCSILIKYIYAHFILASSDHVARLWEMASGETVRQYNGHHKGGIFIHLADADLDVRCIAVVCCALHDGAG